MAERLLDLEHEGQAAVLTVTLGKPFYVDARGWACPFRTGALGREHMTPAGGVDSVHAIQLAMHMIHKQLNGMARHHTISFLGTQDFGFTQAGGGAADEARCPVPGGGHEPE